MDFKWQGAYIFFNAKGNKEFMLLVVTEMLCFLYNYWFFLD